MAFFSELRRRNVIRVAALYAVSSWLILQVADVLAGLFGLPDWTLRFVGFVLLLGFPIALVLSWIYELTPEGVKRETEIPGDQSITAHTAHRLNWMTVIIGGLTISLVAWQQFAGAPRETGAPPQTTAPAAPAEAVRAASAAAASAAPVPSADGGDRLPTIAVLPFANLSDDSENEYFADGVAEEVLNLISRSDGLRVISRSSSFSFKGRQVPIPELAEQLGASHLLEGSIRRAGDRIRITAQFIDAGTDTHLWSETYDRELTDVFAVQDEIAQAIASALAVRLASAGDRSMDIDVYELILQARASMARREDEAAMRHAESLLEEATRIDPENPEAWGQLALAQLLIAIWYPDADAAAALARTEQSARAALELDGANVAGLTALGTWHMYAFEFEQAETLLRAALAIEPNSIDANNFLNDFFNVVNDPDRAVRFARRSVLLDPLMAVHSYNLGLAIAETGDLGAAAEAFRAALSLEPGFESAMVSMLEMLVTRRAFESFSAFTDSYEGPLEELVDVFVGLASLIEAGQTDEALKLNDALNADSPIGHVMTLRMIHGLDHPAPWDALVAFLEAVGDGVPLYVWPFIAPTDPRILALSDRYRAFWETPPRDRLLEVRGHRIGGQDD